MNATTTAGAARYRTKSAEIDAIRWTGATDYEHVLAFLGADFLGISERDLIDIKSGTGLQVAEAGDWIIRHADGTCKVLTDAEFRRDYAPVDDVPEYGWNGVIADHPQHNTVRIPLHQDGPDAGVLVLDHSQTRELADALADLLNQDGQPAIYQWAGTVTVSPGGQEIEIPFGRDGNYLGVIQMRTADTIGLWGMLDDAIKKSLAAKRAAASRAADRA